MEGRACPLKVVPPLSLPLVSLEMFFFKVVLHCDTYCPALKRGRKTQPDLPVLPQGNIFFSYRFFIYSSETYFVHYHQKILVIYLFIEFVIIPCLTLPLQKSLSQDYHNTYFGLG